MRTNINIEELEKKLDFRSLNQKLLNQLETGGFTPRKTVANLLDNVADTLIKARNRNISFKALAEFLKQNGLPVSEGRLRDYLHSKGVAKQKRQPRPTQRPRTTATMPEPEQPKTCGASRHAEPLSRKLENSQSAVLPQPR